ncbi:uncharacterized protein METZ01_LOCUS376388, partial [marine metagenome]
NQQRLILHILMQNVLQRPKSI